MDEPIFTNVNLQLFFQNNKNIFRMFHSWLHSLGLLPAWLNMQRNYRYSRTIANLILHMTEIYENIKRCSATTKNLTFSETM